jgi:RNA polymerase sigma-70 factor (ECF subfamily)
VEAESLEERLSRISTCWTVVRQAQGGPAESVRAAQQHLLERYRQAVHRYLLGALRDADAADELLQDFALRLLSGRLGGAEPQRGRFRDFVKGVLVHLVADFHRRQRSRPQPLPSEATGPDTPAEVAVGSDQEFLDSWRNELLAHSWQSLAALDGPTGQSWHTVLRCRAEHPDWKSAQMAEQLAVSLGRPVTAAWVRKTLERARVKFADFLIDEVVQTLAEPTRAELEEELLDLGLLEYCRPALERYQDTSAG